MATTFEGLIDILRADSQDVNILVLSDSTGTNPDKWVYDLGQRIAAGFPTYTVAFDYYRTTFTDWASASNIQTGTGSHTVKIWNASVGGYSCDDHVTDKATVMEHPSAVDYVAVSLGHNSPYAEVDFTDLFDTIQASWPSRHITVFIQNVRYDDDTAGDTARANAASAAASYGYPTVDIGAVWEANSSAETDWMADDVHPNDTGYNVWADQAYAAIRSGGIAVSSLLDSATLLLRADNYSGSGDWLDESGNGLDGSITGATFVAASGGEPAHFAFTGSDLINCGTSSLLNMAAADSMTVMVVAQHDAWVAAEVLVSDRGGNNAASEGYAIFTAASAMVSEISDGTNETSCAGERGDDTSFHTYAFVRDVANDDLLTFTDGAPSVAGASTDTTTGDLIDPAASGRNFTIGAFHSGSGGLNGKVRAVAVWRSALSDAEVLAAGQALVASGKNRFTTVFAPLARW